MAEKTGITWTDSTFNPWRGCTKVSPGCAHCYAETLSHRNPAVLGVWGPQGTRVFASAQQWREPLKWDRQAQSEGRRHRVFCASLADVFEEWEGPVVNAHGDAIVVLPRTADEQERPFTLDDARGDLWALIRATPHLDWQILTKRPENIPRMMPAGDWPNVWLGVSVETQEYAWRVDALQEAREVIRCPVGFVSYEPALGPLTLGAAWRAVQWVIVGGESGSDRPMRLAWAHAMVDECAAAGVACFVKQLGAVPVGPGVDRPGLVPLTLAHPKGGDMAEWPDGLRVRQFPA